MRAVVTGAASGIGRAISLRLARDGKDTAEPAKIALVDIEISAALSAVADEVHHLGAEVLPLAADLATSDQPEQAVVSAIETFGGLDALVSNAGVNCRGQLLDYAVADWDRLFAVNTRALWLLAKASHGALKQSGGSIVAIASMSGSNTHASLGAYGPSKAAVIMLAKVLSQEFGPDGVRVNTVSPGMVRTGMTEMVYSNNEIANARDGLVPIGRVALPEDMADVVAFLLSPDARYINGHDLVADGGVTGNYLGRLPGLSKITRG
ncbi:MAG: SDR family oxidoreductase [Alphaproteobacteria bacterium]